MGLAGFPDVSLADAGQKAAHARRQRERGLDRLSTVTHRSPPAASQPKTITFERAMRGAAAEGEDGLKAGEARALESPEDDDSTQLGKGHNRDVTWESGWLLDEKASFALLT